MGPLININAFAIPTEIFRRREDLFHFLEKYLTPFSLEGKIIAITSKIVSLAEDRVVSRSKFSKKELVEKEADHYLCPGGFGCEITIKHGILIPSSGIDESNSESGDYILYPEKPYESAQAIWRFLKENFNLTCVGVIITDSHSTPLRRGVTGISLAHWGLRPTKSLVGKPDLFQKNLKFTHVNVVDSLASLAVFTMGEANEGSPLALISGAQVEFTETSSEQEIRIEPENDIYAPLLLPYLKR